MKIKKNTIQRLAILVVLLTISCTSGHNEQEKIDSVRATEDNHTLEFHNIDTVLVDQIKVTRSNLQIVKIDTTATLKDSTSEYKEACIQWKLDEEEIIKIFVLSKIISGSEIHDLYYDLPCRINGEVRIGKVLFNFIINGGSFVYVYNFDQKFYLGCSQEKCKEFFIEQGGNMARDVPDF